jgi:hypothetical protein
LGVAVVGGLLFSQLLTLYITPVFYLYMESFQKKMVSLFRRRRVEAPETASPAGAAPAPGLPSVQSLEPLTYSGRDKFHDLAD